MLECTHRSKYLGLPFCNHHSKSEAFQDIIGRLKQKLAGWKSKVLSFAGRGVLTQAVVQTIPTYAMQTYVIPAGICRKIDGHTRDFWWGFSTEGQRHLYLKLWHSICAPKEASSLGFRRLQEMNEAFLTKLAWQLINNQDKFGIVVLRSKYLRGLDFMDPVQKPKRGFWIWNAILDSRKSLANGACYWIDSHSTVRIRDDPWIPSTQGFKIPSTIQVHEHLSYVKDLMIPNGGEGGREHESHPWLLPLRLCQAD